MPRLEGCANPIRFVFLQKESGTDGLSDTKVTIDAAMAFSSEKL